MDTDCDSYILIRKYFTKTHPHFRAMYCILTERALPCRIPHYFLSIYIIVFIYFHKSVLNSQLFSFSSTGTSTVSAARLPYFSVMTFPAHEKCRLLFVDEACVMNTRRATAFRIGSCAECCNQNTKMFSKQLAPPASCMLPARPGAARSSHFVSFALCCARLRSWLRAHDNIIEK